LNDYWFTFL